MADAIVKETVEVTEPEVTPEAPAAPTREDLKSKGWTAAEMEAAEKRGMIAKPEDAAAKQAEADAKAKADADTKAKADEEARLKEKIDPAKPTYRGTPMDDVTLTPEQEKVFLDTFGPGTPHRAMYFRAKNERRGRQAADQRAEAAEKRAEAAEARAKALEATKVTPELDENGDPIDPASKPLTRKDLEQIEKEKAEKAVKEQETLNEQARRVHEAQTTQEEDMRATYPDFDQTAKLAGDVIASLRDGTLETIAPDKWKQAKVLKLVRDLQIAAANADKLDLDDYHGARIAYEIGQFHPDYGKNADAPPNGDASDKDGKLKDPKKANGSLTPEQMKRIEATTQRRASSASVTGGGGKRTISVDDVDLATLNGMSYSERQKFREKHPDRYAKLLRG